MGLRPATAGGLSSPVQASDRRSVTSPTLAPAGPKAPARDRTGARKALLQWAQSTTKT